MKRFVILADAHVGTPQTQFPGQDYVYAADVLRRAIEPIRAQRPDEIVILGDLVNMGAAEEYDLVRNVLADVGAPISLVPGNHELVKGTLADFSSHAIGATLCTLRANDDGPIFAWLNTGIEGLPMWHWHGRMDEASLRVLDEAIQQRGDRPFIIFCHHPPDGTVIAQHYPMMGLVNRDEVMARLMRHRAPVVLFCGHTHIADVWRRRNINIIAAPPLAFWPHAFLVAEIRGNYLAVQTHRIFDSPQASPDPKIHQPGYVHEHETWVPRIEIRL